MLTLQLLLSAFLFWSIAMGLLGLSKEKGKKRERAASTNPVHRFAVTICAHDEEKVIGHLLECLENQDYPADMYHIFVLADHCTDSTVAQASAHPSVTVWERTDGSRTGKGAVLNWGLNRILRDTSFDCVLFFDADNQIGPDFLRHMDGAFKEGASVVTGNRLSQNPYDSLVSQWYTLYWAILDSLYNRPRNNLGLSSMLSGTGFAFRADLLREKGWNTCSLSEDIEFSVQQTLEGHRVRYLDEGIFYDEQPTRLPVMWTQLSRWCTGAYQIAFHYFIPWCRAFASRPSWRLWDMFMGVGLTVAFGLATLNYFVLAGYLIWRDHLMLLLVPSLIGYLATILTGFVAAKMDGWPARKLFWGIITMPLFYSLFSFISVRALLFPQKKWVRIEHKSSKMHF